VKGHLIQPLRNLTLAQSIEQLAACHDFIVERCRDWQCREFNIGNWAIQVKRQLVQLGAPGSQNIVGKIEESFPELVNLLAATERMIATLRWFHHCSEFSDCIVSVCHPATSGVRGENDLMLTDSEGALRVRCEVCDVVPAFAGQNGKEESDLKALIWNDQATSDGCRRFISTSAEFASALCSPGRRWLDKTHRFLMHGAVADYGTTLLEVLPPNVFESKQIDLAKIRVQ
jgi:hypothetical protein